MIVYLDKENRWVPWQEDAEFRRVLQYVTGVTVTDPMRMHLLWQCARLCSGLPGAMAEVGVYRGGSAYVMAQGAPGRDLHLFDTFAGMPDLADEELGDRHQAGDFADTSAAAVRAYLAGCEGIRLHPGIFPGSAAGLDGERFFLAHVDVDLYESTFEALGWLWPRMVAGGMILVDDYGFLRTEGARRAVDDFCRQERLVPLALATGQAMLMRLL